MGKRRYLVESGRQTRYVLVAADARRVVGLVQTERRPPENMAAFLDEPNRGKETVRM